MRRAFPRRPRGDSQHARIAEQCRFTLADLGYRFPDFPLPSGRHRRSIPASAHPRGREASLRDDNSRIDYDSQLDHELAIIEKLGLAGYFLIVWDIVALLPARRHPRPGPRLGGQQRRLLCARHHRGRCRRHGAVVRALSLRGARRVARHRHRPAERRSTRAGHPVRLPALRRARRGDDRQRHHLPHAQRGARGRQGARLSSNGRSTGSRSCCVRTASATISTSSPSS